MYFQRLGGTLVVCAVFAGCSKSDEKADAIATLFAKFKASALQGGPTIDPALFAQTPTSPDQNANPVAPPSDASRTLALGAKSGDGTAGINVTVTRKFTANPDGTGIVRDTVVEAGTGFKFLDYAATLKEPEISYRIPSFALRALKADGTGTAFMVLQAKSSGTVASSFTNTNPANGHKLINMTGLTAPPASATGKGVLTQEFLQQIELSRVSGQLVAKLTQGGAGVSSSVRFERTGGPATADVVIAPTRLTIGGVSLAGPEYEVSAGNDFPGAASVAADAAVEVAFSISGGVTGGKVRAGVNGPFAQQGDDLTAPYSFSAPMAGLDGLNDGLVQLSDNDPTISVFEAEDTPLIDHSIADDDLLLGLSSEVWAPSLAIALLGTAVIR